VLAIILFVKVAVTNLSGDEERGIFFINPGAVPAF
jgi:hypothetical protein